MVVNEGAFVITTSWSQLQDSLSISQAATQDSLALPLLQGLQSAASHGLLAPPVMLNESRFQAV